MVKFPMCFYSIGRWNVSWNENEMDGELFKNSFYFVGKGIHPGRGSWALNLLPLIKESRNFSLHPVGEPGWQWRGICPQQDSGMFEMRCSTTWGDEKGTELRVRKQIQPWVHPWALSLATQLSSGPRDTGRTLINRGAGRRTWDRVGEGILWNLYLQIQV